MSTTKDFANIKTETYVAVAMTILIFIGCHLR